MRGQGEIRGAVGQGLGARPHGERRAILAHMAPQPVRAGRSWTKPAPRCRPRQFRRKIKTGSVSAARWTRCQQIAQGIYQPPFPAPRTCRAVATQPPRMSSIRANSEADAPSAADAYRAICRQDHSSIGFMLRPTRKPHSDPVLSVGSAAKTLPFQGHIEAIASGPGGLSMESYAHSLGVRPGWGGRIAQSNAGILGGRILVLHQ